MVLPVSTKLLNSALRDIVPLFLAVSIGLNDLLYPLAFYLIGKWKIVILWYNGFIGIGSSLILLILLAISFRPII